MFWKMTDNIAPSVTILSQPELLGAQELCEMLKARCCRVNNLETMSKENLVKLFRKIILPLPQRLYRSNRRGRMLTARRKKAGLEGSGNSSQGGAGKGSKESQNFSRLKVESPKSGESRLKPPPTSDSNKVFLRTGRGSEGEKQTSFDTSSTKIVLKRTAESANSDRASDSGGKKQRVAIKWP